MATLSTEFDTLCNWFLASWAVGNGKFHLAAALWTEFLLGISSTAALRALGRWLFTFDDCLVSLLA